MSSGEWEIVEKENWCYYAFCGKYLSLVKLVGNEIAEGYRLGYLDTAGKRISDVNIWLYKIYLQINMMVVTKDQNIID